MHMYVNIFVCKNTLKCASPVATPLHMLIMFPCLLLTAHLYICSYKYMQTNPIRSGEQSKRWHDYQRESQFQTSEGHEAFSWRSSVGCKKFREDPTNVGWRVVEKRTETKRNTLTPQCAHAYADSGTIKPNKNSDWGSSRRTNKEHT